jgi:cytochrome b6-f complex iron-sulfur subunit
MAKMAKMGTIPRKQISAVDGERPEAVPITDMAKDSAELSRRTLMLSLLPSGLAAAGLVAGTGALLLPPQPRLPGRIRRVCRLADMDVGGQVTLPDNVLLVRDHSGLHAMSLVCTHLGCGVTRHQHGFQCHCHGSLFDEQGRPLNGPAVTPLPWYSVTLRDGWVMVDLDRVVELGTITPA